MARTIEEIQTEILRAKDNEPALSQLNSTSKTAIWRLWMYITAYAIHTLERIFDTHRSEINTLLAQQKPHTAHWYRNKALAFQYGFDLLPESDVFNNEGKTEDEINASKIIKYSAVTEDEHGRRLIVKITGEHAGKLSQLPVQVETAFKVYMAQIKDAGVSLTVINYLPDVLRLHIRIVRNPLVLDLKGMDILSGKYPVNEAIAEFLKNLPFDGELSLQKLTDRLQKVSGVEDLKIDLAQSRWIDSHIGTYGNWENIDLSKIPVSGYFAVNLEQENETQSVITYV